MAERIKEHPILGVQEKGASVKFTFDGKEMEGMEGEPIAAALRPLVLWFTDIQRKNTSRVESSVRSEDAPTA